MKIVDTAAAIGRLQLWSDQLSALAQARQRANGIQPARDLVLRGESTALMLIKAADPRINTSWAGCSGARTYTSEARSAALAAIGALADASDLAAMFEPTGPRLQASAMHPAVWHAAEKLWNDGHYGPAVQRGATAVVELVRDLTGRADVSSDTSLMQQIFTREAPTATSPRLRWPGNETEATVRSMQDGLRQLAPGLLLTVRNPVTHSTADLDEQRALEQLAALSVLARFIDDCSLETAPYPEDTP